MTTTTGGDRDDEDDDLPTWTPDTTERHLVEALEHGTAWTGGADSVPDETWVVGAAGVWDDLGCVLVLYRSEEGLDHDVHVVPRDASGRWHPTGTSSGTTLPEWLLDRPEVGPGQWRGTQTQVVVDQITGCGTEQDDGRSLGEETYWPLMDIDRHWPDESLWTGYDGW